MALPLAVVEIGGTALLIAAVFILTFLFVCLAAYWLLKGSGGSRGATPGPVAFQFQANAELPVSKQAFESIVRTQTGGAQPEMANEQTGGADIPVRPVRLAGLDQARDALFSVYRIVMIGVGLAGLTASILMFRQATPANMMLLPAAMIGLFSLGALGKGLIPDRKWQRGKPIDPALLNKIRVQTSAKPLTIDLGQFEMMKAADMLQRGASPEAVARAVYPTYDALQEFEQAAVQQLIAKAVKAYLPQKP
jgi:hypothetical protein